MARVLQRSQDDKAAPSMGVLLLTGKRNAFRLFLPTSTDHGIYFLYGHTAFCVGWFVAAGEDGKLPARP